MAHVYRHQFDQIVTYLMWGLEWIADDPSATDEYREGAIASLGHQLSCWVVQIAGLEDCETVMGVELVQAGLGRRGRKALEATLRSWLRDQHVEVRDG